MLGACWGASTCIRLTQLCKTKQAQTKHRKQGCAPQVCLANASDARSSARSGKLKKGITIRGAQSRGMLGACWGASTCIRITQLCTIKQAQTKHRNQGCAPQVCLANASDSRSFARSSKLKQSIASRGAHQMCIGKCIRLTQLCKFKQAQTKYHNQGCAPEACLAHVGVQARASGSRSSARPSKLKTKHRILGCAPEVCLANASDSRSFARPSKLKQSITIRGAHQRHAWRMLG